MDGKYKSTDISAVVSLATQIHGRYEDFSDSLFNAFKKKFAVQKSTGLGVRISSNELISFHF